MCPLSRTVAPAEGGGRLGLSPLPSPDPADGDHPAPKSPQIDGVRQDPRTLAPPRVAVGLYAVNAWPLDFVLEPLPVGGGDLAAVAQQPQAARQRRPRPQGAAVRRRLRAHRQVVRLEREAAGGCDRVDGDVAAALPQRAVHLRAVVLEPARGRLLAEHVGADLSERAAVRHHPKRHERPDPLAELMSVESADCDHTARAQELVPATNVALGRVAERAARHEDEAGDLRDARGALGGVVHEAPELDPVQRLAVESLERHPGGALKSRRALREGVGREPETARIPHRPADAGSIECPVVDGLVEVEGEVVVAPARRHLLTDQHQDVAVPSLLTAFLGLERVVVREQEDRKSTRLNSSHTVISYAVFCLKKKKQRKKRLSKSLTKSAEIAN